MAQGVPYFRNERCETLAQRRLLGDRKGARNDANAEPDTGGQCRAFSFASTSHELVIPDDDR